MTQNGVHWYGWRFLADVWNCYRTRTITARGAILLSHVDRFCNPPMIVCPGERPNKGREPVESKRFCTSTLETILCCSDRTVWQTVDDLRKLRKLFKARKVGQSVWELKTRQREQDQAFYVPPQVRRLFEEGHFTADQAFVMGSIASFTRNGQLCWVTNKQIAFPLGLKPRGAGYHVSSLVEKGELTMELMPHDEAREALTARGIEGFKRRGFRTTRFLHPTRVELWKGNEKQHSVFDVVKFELPDDDEEDIAENHAERADDASWA